MFIRPKGQKTSKANYGFLNSSKKWPKNKITWGPIGQIFSFFGRIEDTINWFRDFLTFNAQSTEIIDFCLKDWCCQIIFWLDLGWLLSLILLELKYFLVTAWLLRWINYKSGLAIKMNKSVRAFAFPYFIIILIWLKHI